MLGLIRQLFRSSKRLKSVARIFYNSKVFRLVLVPFYILDNLNVLIRFRRASKWLEQIIESQKYDIIIVEPREFHSEVIAAVSSQLQNMLWHPAIITTPQTYDRLSKKLDPTFAMHSDDLRAVLKAALKRNFPVICTTDFFGFPEFVITHRQLSGANALLLVHNFDRYTHRNTLKNQTLPVLPSLQVDQYQKKFFLVESPILRDKPGALNKERTERVKVGIIGQTQLSGEAMEELVRYSRLDDRFELYLIGNFSKEIKQLVKEAKRVVLVGSDRPLTDEELENELEILDLLLFAKNAEHYKRNWSGMAQHSLTHSLPMIVPQKVAEAWEFPVGTYIGYEERFTDGLVAALELDVEQHAQLRNVLYRFARTSFSESSEVLSEQLIRRVELRKPS